MSTFELEKSIYNQGTIINTYTQQIFTPDPLASYAQIGCTIDFVWSQGASTKRHNIRDCIWALIANN
jgi:hypothetical protein